MKEHLIILSFLFSSISIVNAQQWDSLGNGILSNSPGSGYAVWAQTSYKGNLYVGGKFDSAGRIAVNNIAEWNGAKWLNVDIGTNYYLSAYVDALCVYNGQLYAGGVFDSIGGKSILSIASWNGVTWSAVGAGMPPHLNWAIYTICVYNGDLYVGGVFDSIGDIKASNIAKWNGTSWSGVGTGISYNPSFYNVDALCVYKGQLYVGGEFDTAGGIPTSNIASWSGSTWSPLGNGINNNGVVYAMTVYDGSLYIGGEFDSANGNPINNIATWNGTNWSSLGKGIPDNHGNYQVSTLCVYDSAVCVGGFFDTAGNMPANNIAYWNGTKWSAFGSGVNGDCATLYSFNSILYGGGTFSLAGGIPANNIAQWTGGILGINNLGTHNNAIVVYPNPNNGQFTLSLSNVNSACNIEIYNVLGDNVYKEALSQSQSNKIINMTGQPSGVYLYRVLTKDGGLVGEGKVLVQK